MSQVNRRQKVWLVLIAAALLFATGTQIALAGGRPLSAMLTGAAEVPNPGDPDGSGSAYVTLNQGLEQICFDIMVADVEPIAAAHIHTGAAGVPGGVVVSFDVPANGLSGCVSASADLIKDIRQNPEMYYVNVHNAAYPAGALRGQLSK